MMRLPRWFVVVLALVVLVGFTMSVGAAETTKGKIKSIGADKKSFVMTDVNGKDWTFQMREQGKVRIADRESKLEDLKVGDQVEITYEKVNNTLFATEVKCERQ